jgi:hypothetical protein
VLTLATMPLTAVAAHSKYLLTRIADDTGLPGTIGISAAALNGAGRLAFMANVKTGEPVLLVASGGDLTTVADTSGHFRRLGFPTRQSAAIESRLFLRSTDSGTSL